MAIDKKLLRAAWPKGYLAMRGVYTIEGWLFSSDCLIFSEYGFYKRAVCERTSCVVHKAGTNNHVVQGWIDEGDLLPNVDPTDTATWACLLKNMCDLVGVISDHQYHDAPNGVSNGEILGYTLELQSREEGATSDWPHAWNLMAFTQCTNLQVFTFVAKTQDPAMALVLGFINLREILDPIIELTSDDDSLKSGDSSPSVPQ